MPKNDLVPCFYAGSAQDSAPDFHVERGTAREWRTEGKGYFADSGTRFQLIGAIVSPERGISSNAAAVPFSRIPSPLRKPPSIHYPIPACGDHRLRWIISFLTPEVAELAVE